MLQLSSLMPQSILGWQLSLIPLQAHLAIHQPTMPKANHLQSRHQWHRQSPHRRQRGVHAPTQAAIETFCQTAPVTSPSRTPEDGELPKHHTKPYYKGTFKIIGDSHFAHTRFLRSYRDYRHFPYQSHDSMNFGPRRRVGPSTGQSNM